MPAETAHSDHCNIALIGTKFMGRAHSNAYLKVDNFFDVLLSAYWKFCEISTLAKDIKSAVVLHQDLRIMSRHH